MVKRRKSKFIVREFATKKEAMAHLKKRRKKGARITLSKFR